MTRDDDIEVRVRLPREAVGELREVARICGVGVGRVVRDIVLWRLGWMSAVDEEAAPE